MRQIMVVNLGESESRFRYPWLDLIIADMKVNVGSQSTLMFFAALAGNICTVRRLLEEGADARAADDDSHGGTALMAAARNGHTEIVQLLQPFSDSLAVDCDGETAMMLSAGNGHAKIVELLLPTSDPFAKNKHGLSAADWARRHGHGSIAELIDAYALSKSEELKLAELIPAQADEGAATRRSRSL